MEPKNPNQTLVKIKPDKSNETSNNTVIIVIQAKTFLGVIIMNERFHTVLRYCPFVPRSAVP